MATTTTATDDRLAQLDTRFQERLGQVPVLAQRAEAEGITAIKELSDLVPLLFPHTTYKSYPEALVTKGRFDQMNRWLDSLSTHRVGDLDVTGVRDVDDWIECLEAAGHMVSSSSGTSGKGSFLNKTMRDRQASLDDLFECLSNIGLVPDRRWHVVPVGPDIAVSHHLAVRQAIIDAYGRPDGITVPTGAAPLIGHHRYMNRLSAMRRAMAEGTASPDEVAAFEAEATERQNADEQRLSYLADQVMGHADEPLFFNATFPLLFRLCQIMRERGISEGDISAENALTTGGGLKGMALPEDYQSQIFTLLNIAPERFLHYYSMQELNTRMPKCLAGRYHVPDKLTLLVLDGDGEQLAPFDGSVVSGRAAFFDSTVDGRWGGTITGDQINADFGTCSCGMPGPTISDAITRYSNLPDGDKITCAGTMDAYVRGFIED
jgi:hypothetical protein